MMSLLRTACLFPALRITARASIISARRYQKASPAEFSPEATKLSLRPNQPILELTEDIMDVSSPKLSRKRIRNIMLNNMGISKKAAKEQGLAAPKFLDALIESQASCKQSFGDVFMRPPSSSDSSARAYQYNIQPNEVPQDTPDMVKQILSMDMANQHEINQLVKNRVIQHFAIHVKDTGSVEVQIGVLTVRILVLLDHLAKYRKDHSSKKIAIQLVQQRKRLLQHLKRVSLPRYFDMMAKLNLTWTDIV